MVTKIKPRHFKANNYKKLQEVKAGNNPNNFIGVRYLNIKCFVFTLRGWL